MSEHGWLKYFLAKRNMGAVICEGPEIEAACAELDRLHSDYAALLARHNALVEAVAWERECIRQLDYVGKFWENDNIPGRELIMILGAARAEVDRLLKEA